MIKVIYEDNHLLVCEKPINIPMMEDESKDLDFLNICKQYLKEKYQKEGNVYLALLHRLDRPVGGVCVFAKTSKAASRLSETIRTHQMEKEYIAVVLDKENKLLKKDTFKDYLLKDSKTNTTIVSAKGKYSELSYDLIKNYQDLKMVAIKLKTGRSHQIRVQFSSRNFPLYGDQRYNKFAEKGQQIALFARKISFIHPTTKELKEFECQIPNRFPFNI